MYTWKIKFSLLAFILLLACTTSSDSWNFYHPDHEYFFYNGRFDQEKRCSFPGSSIHFSFEGTGLKLLMKHEEQSFWQQSYYHVSVDTLEKVLKITSKDTLYTVFDDLSQGVHKVQVTKRTEANVGIDQFLGVAIKEGKLLPNDLKDKKNILFFGNSITCGYGNELSIENPSNAHFTAKNENHYQSYAAITARNLNVLHTAIAFSGIGIYRNFDRDTVKTMHWCYNKIHPLPGENEEWSFKDNPELIIVNLGTNDFFGTIPPKDKFVSQYVKLLQKINDKYDEVPFLLCLGPMLNDFYPPGQYSYSTCKSYLKEIRDKLKGVANVKLFFFEPQQPPYGEDYHPTIATHQKMADTLTAFIKEQYKW